MRRLIPIEIFDSAAVPILVVDTGGTIHYANRAVADRFVVAGELAVGRSCWKITRLGFADGRRLCRRDCPLRRAVCEGRVPAAERVIASAGRLVPEHYDLLNLLLPPARGDEPLLLHFLVPGRLPEAPCLAPPAPAAAPAGGPRGRLHLLTPRELQVLEGLAGGLDAVAVADRLDISLNTARNHIRSILAKLRVHRQVDAVLRLLGRQDLQPPARRGRTGS